MTDRNDESTRVPQAPRPRPAASAARRHRVGAGTGPRPGHRPDHQGGAPAADGLRRPAAGDLQVRRRRRCDRGASRSPDPWAGASSCEPRGPADRGPQVRRQRRRDQRRVRPRDHGRPGRLDAPAADARAVRRRRRSRAWAWTTSSSRGRSARTRITPATRTTPATPTTRATRRSPCDPASPIADATPCPGWGGRQPVAYVGPAAAPLEEVPDPAAGRGHPRHRLRRAPLARPGGREGHQGDGQTIGYDDPVTDPETFGDLPGQLDGVIDPLSGHGTFISGLVHQACPDADLLVWRVVPSDGPDRRVRPGRVAGADRGAGPQVPRRRARRAGHRRPHPVPGLLPRDAGRRALRPDHVRDPRGAVEARHPGGVLGGQRRHQPPELPGRLRSVGQRLGPDPAVAGHPADRGVSAR